MKIKVNVQPPLLETGIVTFVTLVQFVIHHCTLTAAGWGCKPIKSRSPCAKVDAPEATIRTLKNEGVEVHLVE